MLELNDIRAFLTLAEELHFGRTAARLHLTQARVSQIIAALERRVGGQLFRRTSRQVSITPLGEKLRDAVAAPYRDLIAGVERTANLATRRPDRVLLGVLPTTARRVHEVGRQLDAVVGRVEVVPVELPLEGDVYRRVTDGEVDALLIWRTGAVGDALTEGPTMLRSPRMAAMAAGHPLASRRSITLADTDEWGLNVIDLPDPIRLLFLPEATPDGAVVRGRSMSAHGVGDLWAQVALGRFIHATAAELTDLQPPDVIAAVPISDLPPLELVIVTRTSDDRPAIRALASLPALSNSATAADTD